MDPDLLARLLRGLSASDPPPSPELRERARLAVADAPDWPTVGERLADLGLLTRYQLSKLKYNKPADIVFGAYLIAEKIGEGGMGKVYRAIHQDTGQVVALKVVRPHLMTNTVVQRRYAREARAAAAFDHPNIIKLLAEDTVEGRYFLAMEFIDGTDLSRLVKEFGKAPTRGLDEFPEACEYIRQTALGLQHAHDRGFVHRDVKPSNILVYGERAIPGTDGIAGVKILDMGLVRRLMGGDDDLHKTELTRDGTVVGTPDYMSPEQAKNSSAVDGRADLYSLGCTLYFLLHGRPPFDGGSPIDKLLKHHTQPAPDPRVGRPDVPPELARIIHRLMRKKPEDRYSNAAAVADALRPFCTGFAPVVLPSADAFSLGPAVPSAAPPEEPLAPVAAAPAAPPPPPRQLRLKVKEPPTKVPSATAVTRPDQPVSSPSTPALRARPAESSGSGDLPRRRTGTLERPAALDDTPPSGRARAVRRPVKKKPIWPVIVAVTVGVVLLLGAVATVLLRGPGTPTTPTGGAAPPDPGKAAPARPVAAGGDVIADRASAVVVLRPPQFASRLTTSAGGRLNRVLKGFAASGLDGRANKVTVSLVGGQAVAVGEPAGLAATDPTLRAGLEARRAAGRPAAGLSADLLSAVKASDDAAAGLAADGGFVLPGGDTLASGRVSWAAARAVGDSNGFDLSVTLAGPDRGSLLDFVSLEVANKLPAAVPALKLLCERLVATEPTSRRTESGLELTYKLRVDWPELLGLLDQLVPGG